MNRSLRLLAALTTVLTAAAAVPVAGQVVVDEFTTGQATISDPPGGASTAVTAGGDILGQSRGLRVQRFAGAGPVTAGVTSGVLTVGVTATTPDSTGAVFVTWDGDNDPGTIDPTGLGGVDLTTGGAGAFRFTIASATAGTSLVLEVYEDSDSVSRGALAMPAIAAPVDLFVDFASLARAPGAATPADLSAVGAIVLRIESAEASPAVVLDRIATAAPQLAASKVDRTAAGDPIPGAVAPGDTIRYRITISNSGGGAVGVQLSDVLDPNLGLVAGSVRTTPLARPDVYRTLTGQPIDSSAAALPSLLANDADPDGDALAAVPAVAQATSQGGSVAVAADGHFVYTPPAGFNGVDDFAYAIAATAGDPTVDASGAPIGPATARARIVIDRAPPVVTAGGTLAYTENDPPAAVDPALTATDADSASLVSATVRITGNYQNGEDVLSFVDTANITGVFTPATGTLALTGLDTVAAWQSALRSVAYENTSDDPETADRTVTWIASDGVESSAAVTSTIEVTAVNDPPVVTAGGVLAYTENQVATAIDSTITVDDADDADLVSATAQITGNYVVGQDVLACGAPCAGLSPVFNPGTGTLTLSGTASLAVYQAALRGVTYVNTSENPSASARTVTWIAGDGDDSSVAATSTITVTPVNDPPLAGDDSWQTVGNTQLVVDLAALATPHVRDTTPGAADGVRDNDSDPAEGDAHAVSGVVGCPDLTPPFTCATANGGTVVLDASGTFVYSPAAGDAAAADSFQYLLTDDGAPPASDTATVTIQRFERVWYVDNDFGAGGNGTSGSPFNSLTSLNGAGGAGDADGANDYLFVHFGDGTTTGQSSGFVLESGQRLLGEHAGLSIPVDLNGNGSPAVLFAPVPGNRPMLDDTVVGGPEGVSALDVVPAEVAGMNLGGNVNALEWTTTAAFSGSGSFTFRDNVVRGAGAVGVDVNLAGNGALRLAFHDNNLTAGGAGLSIAETGTGSLTIVAFDDNVVHGNTGGAGVSISSATFDSTPGLPINTVAGGTTAIGQSGNGVGGSGLVLTSVVGDLAFTDLDVFADGGAGLSVTSTGALNAGAGTGFRVTVPAGVATIDANGGPAVSVDNASITLPLAFLESTNSTTTGLSLVSAFGGAGQTALSVSSGQVADPVAASGAAVQITGGSGDVTLGIPITNNSGNAVAVSSRSGDTVSFTGPINETGGGIVLTGNSGATISFRGGVIASTGSNAAFSATGGGTIEVCDENPCAPGAIGGLVNSLTTGTGTALNVASTRIGPNGLEFRSISSNGAASGIVLNATTSGGSDGGLRVAGNGGSCTSAGSCTGGAIQNTTGAGVSLTNTSNVSLTRVFVGATGGHGISGRGMTDETGGTRATFELIESRLTSPGDADGESALYFGTSGDAANNQGRLAVTNTTIESFEEFGLTVANNSGSLDVDVTGTTFNDNHDVHGQAGILLFGEGTSGLTLDVATTTFLDLEGAGLQFAAAGTGANALTVTGSTFNGAGGPDNFPNNPYVTINSVDQNTVSFSIQGNSMLDAREGIVVVGDGNVTGRIGDVSANTISGVAFDAIRIDMDGVFGNVLNSANFTWTILIRNNVLSGTSNTDDGIQILNRDHVGTLHLTIENNQISDFSSEAVRYFAGERGTPVLGDTDGRLRIANNTFSNTAFGVGELDIVLRTTDSAIACFDLAGNTSTAGPWTIDFQETETSDQNVVQASLAALAAANGGATVTVSGTSPDFGQPCVPNLP
jgi:uncharacterized repeat protein (TIGR01451 family)